MKNIKDIALNEKAQIIENVLAKYIVYKVKLLISANTFKSKNDYIEFLNNPIKGKFSHLHLQFHIDNHEIYNKTFRKLISYTTKENGKHKLHYLNFQDIYANFKNIEYVGKVNKKYKSGKQFNRNSYFRLKKSIVKQILDEDIKLNETEEFFYKRLKKAIVNLNQIEPEIKPIDIEMPKINFQQNNQKPMIKPIDINNDLFDINEDFEEPDKDMELFEKFFNLLEKSYEKNKVYTKYLPIMKSNIEKVLNIIEKRKHNCTFYMCTIAKYKNKFFIIEDNEKGIATIYNLTKDIDKADNIYKIVQEGQNYYMYLQTATSKYDYSDHIMKTYNILEYMRKQAA